MAVTPIQTCAITKKSWALVKNESKKSGRRMYAEFESLVLEAIEARRQKHRQEMEQTKKK